MPGAVLQLLPACLADALLVADALRIPPHVLLMQGQGLAAACKTCVEHLLAFVSSVHVL